MQEIIGHIKIQGLEFNENSKKWKFLYNGNVENIDISETNIATTILGRRKVVIGDTFKVRMEITEKKTGNEFKNSFKALEVLDFIEGSEQGELL